MILVLSVAGPVLGETDRAGEAEFAVDDQNPAMRTAIGAIGAPGMSWVIVGKFTAGLFHQAHIGVLEFPAGANAIKEHSHFDPGAGPFAKRVAKLVSDEIGIKDERLKINGLFSGADGLQHTCEMLITILQPFDLVTRDKNGVAECERGTDELRVPHTKGVLEMIIESVPPDEEQTEKQDNSQKRESERDPFAQG
jgi:hypothetical protein